MTTHLMLARLRLVCSGNGLKQLHAITLIFQVLRLETAFLLPVSTLGLSVSP